VRDLKYPGDTEPARRPLEGLDREGTQKRHPYSPIVIASSPVTTKPITGTERLRHLTGARLSALLKDCQESRRFREMADQG